jgi:hypothetical protein
MHVILSCSSSCLEERYRNGNNLSSPNTQEELASWREGVGFRVGVQGDRQTGRLLQPELAHFHLTQGLPSERKVWPLPVFALASKLGKNTGETWVLFQAHFYWVKISSYKVPHLSLVVSSLS